MKIPVRLATAAALVILAGPALRAQSNYATPYTFTTLAGNALASPGSVNGIGSAARFNYPYGVAVDSSGNVYVTDRSNSTIRKITAGGVVTTLAGLATITGSADGTGSAARFSYPWGLAVDGAGNVYVADQFNNTIRKITPAGVVTTLAGTAGIQGAADGTGGAAQFNGPNGVAVDGAGNVYVADFNSYTIRKITSGGVVTTLAGTAGIQGAADGTGGAALFNSPIGVAVDSAGNVYVADEGNCTIRKITSAGVVTTLAGTAGAVGAADGTGGAAQFGFPYGVAVDGAGNVYVADTGNQSIRKITSAGVVTTLAGAEYYYGSNDGTGSAALFNTPTSIAVDSAGNLYVADYISYTIRWGALALPALTSATTANGTAGQSFTYTVTFAGAMPATYTAGGLPAGLSLNPTTGVISGTPTASGVFNVSLGATNGAGSATATLTLAVVTPYTFATLAGTIHSAGAMDGTGSAAQFGTPSGVAVDSAGNVYVADQDNSTIRKITGAGVVTTMAGLAGTTGSADGTGSAARFNNPFGIAVDGAGNVYVGDTVNKTIRKITPGGGVTTLAGLAGNSGSADGTGSAAQFNSPEGVALDAAGNVYVADMGNSTIRKITPGGVVATLAGSPGNTGSADGTGSAARFNYPRGVAVDSAGNVYVADTDNHTIRKITSGGVVTTLAGTAGNLGPADGTGGAAQFYYPFGLALDGAGNVYVADYYNNTIRMITPGGVVATLAGSANGSAAQFNHPRSVTVDSAGNVYVADASNEIIRWGALAAPALTSATTASGTAGQSFTYAVIFSGALASSFSAGGLPAGLSLNPATGVISGTPSASGVFNVSLGALNGAGSGSGTLTLTISGGSNYVGNLNGTNSSSTFEGIGSFGVGVPLPAAGWTTLTGSAQIFPYTNGALVDGVSYAPYSVQFNTGVALRPNTRYTLSFDLGYDAGIAGGNTPYSFSLGTLNAGNFTPLALTSGSVPYAGVMDASVANTVTRTLAFTTGPSVSGDPIAVQFAQTGSGTTSDYFGFDNVKLSYVDAPATFAAWQAAVFSAAELADATKSGPNAVYGLDGLSNLVKYALGLEPKTDLTTGLPVTTSNGTDWVYTYTRPSSITDVTYAVEASTDLVNWSTAGVTLEFVSTANGTDTWHARYPLASATKVYFRLKVTR